MTKATTAKVNAAIRRISGDESSELVKGSGYFYFWGEKESTWGFSSVYVYKLSDLSLEEWVAEYETLRREHQPRLRVTPENVLDCMPGCVGDIVWQMGYFPDEYTDALRARVIAVAEQLVKDGKAGSRNRTADDPVYSAK